MIKKIIEYPKTLASFNEWCYSNMNYRKIYEQLGKPRAFDVSLRDGLQGLTKEQQEMFTLSKKMKIYNKIIENHYPKSIECGSIVSTKVYPVFVNTLEMYKYIENEKNKPFYQKGLDNYVFIPSYEKFLQCIKYRCFENFSFVSSASNNFLLKNINHNVDSNYEELSQIVHVLDSVFSKKYLYKTKLYVSCISECPIDGKIHNDVIVDRLVKLNNLQFDSICLSDTCGTLEPIDFVYIVDKCNSLGIPYYKFSLHLHVGNNRENIVEEIIHKALERGIINFDTSYLDTGGCSVTIKKENLKPNLSYELYYKSLVNYILKCK
jgi:hydroxymethylglutaryl-CoA lyase